MEAEGVTDQLFELVEREVFDPEGVQEFLVAHPEYRSAFEEMKAALALSAELPIEEPPASLDAAIFELADTRVPSTTTLDSSSNGSPRASHEEQSDVVQLPAGGSWGQPLAVAAVAMLVVGIGLATIGIRNQPGEGPVAGLETPGAVDVGDEGLAETQRDALDPTLPIEVEPKPAEKLAVRPTLPPEKGQPTRQARARDKRPAEEEPVRVAQAAPDGKPGAPSAEARGKKSAEAAEQIQPLPSLRAPGGKAMPALGDADSATTGSACQKRVALFEKLMASGSYKPSAQEQLDVGLCYKKLGKKKQARRWLGGASEDPATHDRAIKALETLE